MPYISALFVAGITSLADRRDLLSRILQPTSCLHHLVPPSRDAELSSRLRVPSKSPRILNRTEKYQSFMSYAFSHFQ